MLGGVLQGLAGLVLLGAGQAARDEGRQGFEALLAQAQGLIAARKFEPARELLRSAVEEHAERDYVLHHWFEVEDLLAEATFWMAYEPPEAREVVAGELLSWDPSSGRIEIVYRKSQGHLDSPTADAGPGASTEAGTPLEERHTSDFVGTEDLLLHPAQFRGPYEIEIEISAKKLTERQNRFRVLVAWQWGSWLGVDYGEAFGIELAETSQIAVLENGRWTTLDSATVAIRRDRLRSFKVRVSSSAISASYDNGSLFKVQRTKGEPGQFGFSDFEGLEKVTVSGEIDPAWIAGLIDEQIQRDVSAFRRTFDPFRSMPDWLDERATGTPKTARELDRCVPEPSGPMALAELERMQALVQQGKLDAALGLAGALSEPSVGAATKEWILAQIHSYRGDYDRALGHCERVCQADAGFYEARLLRAMLASGLGDMTDAMRELEELVRAFPEYLDTYERLVLLNLVEGRPEGARQVLESAVDNGIPPRALLRAGRTLLRSERGPSWNESHVHESKHYVVASNVSREACFEIASELEDFYQKYVIHVRRPDSRQTGKARVYFFAGLAGYEAYTEDLLGDPAENTLGLYSPWLKQLVIWNSPDKRSVMRTVRHEGFHQYLDQITDQAPVWLNEGLAEYFEQAELVQGRWKDDHVDLEHLAILKRTRDEWTALETLALLDGPGFRVKSQLHYPQAWAFVHFLMNSGPDHEQRIDALLEELAAGTARVKAIDRAFDGVDWKELERAFQDHVASLE